MRQRAHCIPRVQVSVGDERLGTTRDATGNRSKAAEMLGIYRRLLYAKIKEYGLEGYPPKGRAA